MHFFEQKRHMLDLINDNERGLLRQYHRDDHPLLLAAALSASQAHWIAGVAPRLPLACHARCRHRQPLQACTVHVDRGILHVEFANAQRAVTPGQSIVFYDGNNCLGGAVIDAPAAMKE